MKRLWYALRLSTLGVAEWRSLASSLGVMDLTLPAFDSEPCDGTFSHPFLGLCVLGVEVLINIHKFGLLQNIYL